MRDAFALLVNAGLWVLYALVVGTALWAMAKGLGWWP